MDKINFQNGQQPAINDTNLNLLQSNIENEFINVTNWREMSTNLSYNQILTVEGLKTAKEAIVCFNDSGALVPLNYPKNLSNIWMSTYIKTSSGGDGRCSVRINFDTGTIQNGAQGYVDLAISKVLYR